MRVSGSASAFFAATPPAYAKERMRSRSESGLLAGPFYGAKATARESQMQLV